MNPRSLIQPWCLAAVATWLTFSSSIPAQDLTGLIRESGVEWLAGKWSAKTDEGDTLELSYAWELPSALILQKYKSPDREGRAMIYLDPVANKVMHREVGSDGTTGEGEWTAEDGRAILRFTSHQADGTTRRMGFVLRRIDADSMELQIREWRRDDSLGDEARFTLRFRRQK